MDAVRIAGWLESAAVLAKTERFRKGSGIGGDLRCNSGVASLLQPIAVLLNGEGGRLQVLKGLLIQYQIVPVQGHGSGGSNRPGWDHCNASPEKLKTKKWGKGPPVLGGIPVGESQYGRD